MTFWKCLRESIPRVNKLWVVMESPFAIKAFSLSSCLMIRLRALSVRLVTCLSKLLILLSIFLNRRSGNESTLEITLSKEWVKFGGCFAGGGLFCERADKVTKRHNDNISQYWKVLWRWLFLLCVKIISNYPWIKLIIPTAQPINYFFSLNQKKMER